MNELIKITEKEGRKAVSARELYEFLESKQDFSTWIKNRIEKYDFIENVDFVATPQIYGTNNGGHSTRLEYALTVDAAKELSMVENNDKGKQARRYFIMMEKKVIESYSTFKLQDLTAAKMMAVEFTTRMLNLNDASKLPMIKAINEPLGLPTPDYVQSKGVLLSITEIAKEVKLTAAKANQILFSLGVLEQKTRPSSKGEKCFWSITESYSHLGENLLCPSNQKETQPKWYDNKKDEIIRMLSAKAVA